jgi:hypothetical protein
MCVCVCVYVCMFWYDWAWLIEIYRDSWKCSSRDGNCHRQFCCSDSEVLIRLSLILQWHVICVASFHIPFQVLEIQSVSRSVRKWYFSRITPISSEGWVTLPIFFSCLISATVRSFQCIEVCYVNCFIMRSKQLFYVRDCEMGSCTEGKIVDDEATWCPCDWRKVLQLALYRRLVPSAPQVSAVTFLISLEENC